ncbi:MAG: AAA family ATPase [Gammaproteobacteria bacterium]|nr:AAA family ATPase [Gammaproteobacteria bacterium]
MKELYATLKSRTEIALRDFEKGIIVAPRDVGVGISQMIPVIVGCLRNDRGIVAIEQPELHVHPAIQVGLGDLLIRAIQPDGSLYPGQVAPDRNAQRAHHASPAASHPRDLGGGTAARRHRAASRRPVGNLCGRVG